MQPLEHTLKVHVVHTITNITYVIKDTIDKIYVNHDTILFTKHKKARLKHIDDFQ